MSKQNEAEIKKEGQPNPDEVADNLIAGEFGEDVTERGNPSFDEEKTAEKQEQDRLRDIESSDDLESSDLVIEPKAEGDDDAEAKGDDDADVEDDIHDDLADLFGSDDDEAEAEGDDDDDEAEGDDDDDDAEGDDDEGDDDEPEPKPKKKKMSRTQRRIHNANKRAEAAEQKAADLEARMAALEKGLTEKPADDNDGDTAEKPEGEPSPPDPNDFEYGEFDPKYTEARDQYIEDRADYRLEKKLQARDEEQKQAAADAEVEVIRAENQTKFEDTVERGNKKYDDFQEVVVDAADKQEYPLSPVMAQQIINSEVGEDVAYQIASDHKLANKLAKLSPEDQLVAFGRMSARFSGKKPSKQKKRPMPPSPPKKRARGAGGARKRNAADMSFTELEEKYNRDGRI